MSLNALAASAADSGVPVLQSLDQYDAWKSNVACAQLQGRAVFTVTEAECRAAIANPQDHTNSAAWVCACWGIVTSPFCSPQCVSTGAFCCRELPRCTTGNSFSRSYSP